MGKNHRHKKNLKADKGKVKLKQSKTKFLPKGLNETKATFKIKPIVLPEQLKEKSSDVPLSKRNLNLKDLCSRLNHYNENVRCSACEELVEMFKHFSEEIVKDYMSEVILNISNLMQDRERKVRTAAVKVITAILEKTPAEKLEPFFNYFSTNMRCAMTNINQNIQEDSLKFLDCFLLNDCGLISKTSDKLLPDFFTLISRLRSDNNLSRTLTLNLGSKMTSVTWRIKVLSRLHAVLELILNKANKKKENSLYYDAQTCRTIPVYKNHFFQVLNQPYWGTEEDNIDKNMLDNHLTTLIPVLYEIWMEVVPQKKIQKSANESTLLNDEAAAIFKNVVNTIYLLWKYIEKTHGNNSDLKNIFLSIEATKFLNNLLVNFPYTRSDNVNVKFRSKSNVLSLDLNADPNCVKENLIICYIYFVLNANFSRNTANAELECISTYVNKCLLTKKYVHQTSVSNLIEFITICLVEKCHIWKKSRVDVSEILRNAITFYNNSKIGDKYKIKMFKIFAEIVDNPFLAKSSYYQEWLSTLPELLCKPQITDSVVEIFLELARKNCISFLNSLKQNMSEILKYFNTIVIIITKDSFKDEKYVKREIAFIFYYIQELPCLELKQLLQCLSNHISEEDCCILKEYLHRCENECSIFKVQ